MTDRPKREQAALSVEESNGDKQPVERTGSRWDGDQWLPYPRQLREIPIADISRRER